MDQNQILAEARNQIHASGQADPARRTAINLQGLLNTLDQYGPGIVSALAPLGGGLSTASVAAAIVGIVQVIVAGGSATPAPPAPNPAT